MSKVVYTGPGWGAFNTVAGDVTVVDQFKDRRVAVAQRRKRNPGYAPYSLGFKDRRNPQRESMYGNVTPGRRVGDHADHRERRLFPAPHAHALNQHRRKGDERRKNPALGFSVRFRYTNGFPTRQERADA